MNRGEKAFAIFYWSYIAIYVPCFIAMIVSGAMDRYFFTILSFHLFGMLIGIPLLSILIRDIYLREFPNPNSKVTWVIAILVFWPSIPFYLYYHDFALVAINQHRFYVTALCDCLCYLAPFASIRLVNGL